MKGYVWIVDDPSRRLQYVVKPGASKLLDTNFASTDIEGQLREWKALQELCPRGKPPFAHLSLDMDRRDGDLTSPQWRQCCQLALARTGMRRTAFKLGRHRDKDHDHVHIGASLVQWDGKVTPSLHLPARISMAAAELNGCLGLRGELHASFMPAYLAGKRLLQEVGDWRAVQGGVHERLSGSRTRDGRPDRRGMRFVGDRLRRALRRPARVRNWPLMLLELAYWTERMISLGEPTFVGSRGRLQLDWRGISADARMDHPLLFEVLRAASAAGNGDRAEDEGRSIASHCDLRDFDNVSVERDYPEAEDRNNDDLASEPEPEENIEPQDHDGVEPPDFSDSALDPGESSWDRPEADDWDDASFHEERDDY